MSYNVQRFATRRQAQTPMSHAPLDSSNPLTTLHSLGAVYSGAREARGGAHCIVTRRRILNHHRAPPIKAAGTVLATTTNDMTWSGNPELASVSVPNPSFFPTM